MTTATIVSKTISAKEQINVLIEDVKRLISLKEDFQAFIVLAVGIEFLGCFLDSFEFEDYGQSKSRFFNSLNTLFSPKWYRENKNWMFENLRGPLVHQYRPGNEILLTSKCKNDSDLALHFSQKDGKIIFVIERLLDDFIKATKKLDREMTRENSPYSKSKASEKYLNIVFLKKWDETYIELSGNTETKSTK